MRKENEEVTYFNQKKSETMTDASENTKNGRQLNFVFIWFWHKFIT